LKLWYELFISFQFTIIIVYRGMYYNIYAGTWVTTPIEKYQIDFLPNSTSQILLESTRTFDPKECGGNCVMFVASRTPSESCCCYRRRHSPQPRKRSSVFSSTAAQKCFSITIQEHFHALCLPTNPSPIRHNTTTEDACKTKTSFNITPKCI
jgi:hypothetical protein